MDPLLFLLLFITAAQPGVQSVGSVRTLSRISVQRGGSVIVPCVYDQKYKDKGKYWCRGDHQSNCTVMIFTVTLRNLQGGDTATYWCGVVTSEDRESHACASVCLKITGVQSVWTLSRISVQRGRSVTIPCFYDQKYKDNVKYWCKGYLWAHCEILIRTDSPPRKGDVSITDDPIQQVFAVTLRNLQEGDTDTYWCGVKTPAGVIWFLDAGIHLNLAVTEGSAGLSLLNNMMGGEEGDGVSVRCRYGDSLRDSVKRWCRSGDWSSCLTAGGTGTSQHASVLITDDRRGEMSVTVRELQREDAGWYWCAAGEEMFPVHIAVTQRITTQSITVPNIISNLTSKITEGSKSRWGLLDTLLTSAVVVVYLTCTVMAALKTWAYCKQRRSGAPQCDGGRMRREDKCIDSVTEM
ncbi:hypothetical protein AAFF_G00299360 [Aldrovandia affinis]|uniref:Ig-like domain-containing protein n=1 Tax=Aldrovandia affinis TaxID=143900 RepID=A0AAD7R8F6_9TELE|nr:hypothetical protein AAFF_G00299360 [Aldrovandia affinis]